jgi:hypothetical protein
MILRFLHSNIVTVLLTEGLHDLNPLVVENPHIASLKIPLPSEEEMLSYLQSLIATQFPQLPAKSEVSIDVLARRLTGLSRVGARRILSTAITNDRAITAAWLLRMKKDLIERECQDLLEFLEFPFTLDQVAGPRACQGVAPRRYAVASARIVECSADGLPHHGTHWNGQDVHRAMLGGRSLEYHAWSSRTSAIAGLAPPNPISKKSSPFCTRLARLLFLSTKPIRPPVNAVEATKTVDYRAGCIPCSQRKCRTRATEGRIIWVFATSRPDLLEVDLKRQGRLDVHIPLFPPANNDGGARTASFHRKKAQVSSERDRHTAFTGRPGARRERNRRNPCTSFAPVRTFAGTTAAIAGNPCECS